MGTCHVTSYHAMLRDFSRLTKCYAIFSDVARCCVTKLHDSSHVASYVMLRDFIHVVITRFSVT